ncbi:MAG: hypothetical protein C0524_00085 [Rhodobacter sp.]|nr:hypothetical protein [Rhodobacter sp.]
MTILGFWTFLVAAPFGMAAYQQAAEPGWMFPLAALAIAALGLGYIVFGLPAEMFASQAQLDRHPDQLKFRAVVWVVNAGALSLLGTSVGRMFRGRITPARIGVRSFLVAFIGMNAIVLRGAFS